MAARLRGGPAMPSKQQVMKPEVPHCTHNAPSQAQEEP